VWQRGLGPLKAILFPFGKGGGWVKAYFEQTRRRFKSHVKRFNGEGAGGELLWQATGIQALTFIVCSARVLKEHQCDLWSVPEAPFFFTLVCGKKLFVKQNPYLCMGEEGVQTCCLV
jgi:hypothetical protein